MLFGKWPATRYLLLALAILSLGAVAILIELQYPSTVWTEKTSTGEVRLTPFAAWLGKGSQFLTTIIAALAPLQAGLVRSADKVDLEIVDLKAKVHEGARTLFALIASQPGGPPWEKMTARIYCVDRSFREERLTVVADVRHHDRQSSGVPFTKGKGCVGRAWDNRRFELLNLNGRRWRAAVESAENWAKADPEISQGLSYEEALTLDKQGYKVVVAYPVLADDGSEVVGVLAIDSPVGYANVLEGDVSDRAFGIVGKFVGQDLRSLSDRFAYYRWSLRRHR